MLLQAQLLDKEGNVRAYVNRECSTPREAQRFREWFESQYNVMPECVRVVSASGVAAVKIEWEAPPHGPREK
jgi:hypothetical protein